MRKIRKVNIDRTIDSGVDAVAGAERALSGRLRQLGEEELKSVVGGRMIRKP